MQRMCAMRQVMVTKNRLPLVFDKSRPARFGVIPKRPKSGKEVRWFELDPGQQIPAHTLPHHLQQVLFVTLTVVF